MILALALASSVALGAAAPTNPDAFETALSRARQGDWDSLHILGECRFDGDLESVEVFGNGVTIWNRREQLLLSRSSVVAILDLLEASGFSSLPEIYGEGEDEIPVPQAGAPGGPTDSPLALQVACRVEVSIDEASKAVVQLASGEQSQVLRDLAAGIREICRPAARTGISADDLLDGLQKIARGRLAPETLEIILLVKPGRGTTRSQAWQLNLRGPRVLLEHLDSHRVLEIELTEMEVAGLAEAIATSAPMEMPENLFSSDYIDLRIAVLEHHLSIQARQFAGMEPETQGEAQVQFDRLVARLEDLARRIETAESA